MSNIHSENIKVAVRMRPFLQRELESGQKQYWEVPGPTSLKDPRVEKLYVYDRVFDPEATTQAIFNELAEDIVWNCMDGFNGCIFCYGQTGSGKTFTMHGSRKVQPGLVHLTIDTIFAYIQQSPNQDFMIRCSYVEIYNECVNDLLNSNNLNLQVQEDKKLGTRVIGLTEEVCSSFSQVNALLFLGENNKQIASTNFNLRSSRSHCIFRITIESKESSGQYSLAALNMIDLAGSESAAAHADDASANRRQEMKYINRVSPT